MAVESSTKINLGKNEEFRVTSVTKGTVLGTTAAFTQMPALATPGDSHRGRLFATPTTFSTAVIVKLLFNPWLTVLKTTDAMATLPTDYSITAQDNTTSTELNLTSLDTVANGDWLLVGSHQQFRGLQIDVHGTNATATTTAAIHYRNAAKTWVAYSITDGTKSSTALDQDGLLYWTPTSAWVKETFRSIYPDIAQTAYYSDIPLYWARYSFDKALDSTDVGLYSVLAANRSTSYAELCSGQMVSKDVIYGFGGVGNIEALTDAGTATLIVNVSVEGEF